MSSPIYEGDKTLYPPDLNLDGWCISECNCWLPGVYENEDAARMAFCLGDDVLGRLQESVNPGGTITLDMIKNQLENKKVVV